MRETFITSGQGSVHGAMTPLRADCSAARALGTVLSGLVSFRSLSSRLQSSVAVRPKAGLFLQETPWVASMKPNPRSSFQDLRVPVDCMRKGELRGLTFELGSKRVGDQALRNDLNKLRHSFDQATLFLGAAV